jgi:SOS-response transcriptional repressor LexA
VSGTTDKLFTVIKECAAAGVSPTIDEMVAGVGVCRETIRAHLQKLIVQGRIKRTASHTRGWQIVTGPRPEPAKAIAIERKTPAEQASEISRIYAHVMAKDGIAGTIS